MLMIRPLTISECDEQLDRVREQYLLAERRLEFNTAFEKWMELQRLLDVRIRLPLQRRGEGAGPCTECPSPGSA